MGLALAQNNGSSSFHTIINYFI